MFVCCECGEIFSNYIRWKEDRGECFGFPTYEELCGSPCCGGNFVEAFKCDCCDEWITDDYIKVEDKRYCSECYTPMELGDE